MAYVPNSGSVVAFQSNPSVLQAIVGLNSTNASVITVGSPVANQSVSGTVHVDNFSSVVAYQLAGSVLAVSGTFTPAANQSVSGTVDVGNFPTTQNVSGSVAAWLQSTNASVITVSGAQSGSVVAFQGTIPWIIGSIYGNISGSVVAQVSNFPTNQSVSGTVTVTGTVTANQGTGFGSIAAHIKSGSVIAVLGGNTSVLAIQSGTSRPSALSYVTRNDNVASFLGGNLTYTPQSSDSAGRNLIKPFAAEEARIEGYISNTNTSVTTLVAAAGAGLRNYITDVWVANTGASATLVTFVSGGGNSVLGYTIAPAGGGSNLPGLQTPIRTAANSTFDIQVATATSTLYCTVKGYKAP